MARVIGTGILRTAPWLMRSLSVAGTAAMFLVGGGILVHGLAPIRKVFEALAEGLDGVEAMLLSLLLDGLVGIVAGAVVLAAWTVAQRLRRSKVAA